MKKLAAILLVPLILISGCASAPAAPPSQIPATPPSAPQGKPLYPTPSPGNPLPPQPVNATGKLSYPGASPFQAPSDLIANMGISAPVELQSYLIPASLETIIIWYNQTLKDWTVEGENIISIPDRPGLSLGFSLWKKGMDGVFIFVHSNFMEGKTLAVVAQGDWTLVQSYHLPVPPGGKPPEGGPGRQPTPSPPPSGPGAPPAGTTALRILYEVYPGTDAAPVLEFLWGPPELQLSLVDRLTPYGVWEGPPENKYEPAVEMQFYTKTTHDPVLAVCKGTVVEISPQFASLTVRYGRNYGITYHHVVDIPATLKPGTKIEAGTIVGYTEPRAGIGWWEIEMVVKRGNTFRTVPPFDYFSKESQEKLQAILNATRWDYSPSTKSWVVTDGDAWTALIKSKEWWADPGRVGYESTNFETIQQFLIANNLQSLMDKILRGSAPTQNWQAPVSYPDMGKGAATYTVIPLAESDYTQILPLGGLNPPGHTFPTHHMYFVLTDIKKFPPAIPVRAPADGIITIIFYTQRDWTPESGFTGKYNDYGMYIRHTNTFETNFGHICELEPNILAQAGQLKPDKFTENLRIPVKAGDIVGWVGGRPGTTSYCLDFGTINREVTLNFIRPEKYAEIKSSVPPLDYYPDNLKEVFYKKLTRKVDPRGGKIDFDHRGRLSGNWFLENALNPIAEWEKHLAFVYDKDEPTKIIIAVGGTLNIPVGVYEVVGNTPDPAQVSAASGDVIYRLRGGPGGDTKATLIVRVVDDEKIKVEAFRESPASPQFTSEAKYYTR